VRTVEATELLASDMFNSGERRVTLADVEHYAYELRPPVDSGSVDTFAVAAVACGHPRTVPGPQECELAESCKGPSRTRALWRQLAWFA
jgi:hypothetical protein